MKPSVVRTQERLELRLLANAIRAFLGKGPLYDVSLGPSTDKERFYIEAVTMPGGAGGEWFRATAGAEGSREEFRERSVARSHKRKSLKFERKEKSP